MLNITNFSAVQSLRHVQLFATPGTAASQASLSITNSQSLLKLMSFEAVVPSNHLILYRPLLLQSSIFPNIKFSYNESVLRIRWPKYWSLSFSISPFHECSEFISFRMDLFYLAVQGILRSLLQHHSSKASILQHSAFFIIQFWHPHTTTCKSIPLTIWTFISHVCLFFLICCLGLSEIFFQGASVLLSSWLQSIPAVISKPKEIKSVTISIVSDLFAMMWWGRFHDLHLWMLSFKPDFSLVSFTFIKRLLSTSLLFAIRMVSYA